MADDDLPVCCVPVTGAVIPLAAATRLAAMCKALADPTRVRLLSLVAAHEDGEACICDLTGPVDLAQPTVSHHMRQLVEAGLLSREKRGRWAYYRVVPSGLDDVASAVHHLTDAQARSRR